MAKAQKADLFLAMGAAHRGTSDRIRDNLPGKDKQSVLSLSILKYLIDNAGIPQGELGKILRRDPMTMSQAIRALQKSGMVTSTPDKEDKRVKRLNLTRKGKTAADAIRKEETKILNALSKKWGKNKIASFTRDMVEVNEVLNEVLVD